MNIIQRAAGLFRRTPPAAAVQVRGFKAARLDRLTADWLATSQSINQELKNDLDRLRARGRDLVNNNDYARKFVGMVQDNIIGPGGVRLQCRVEDRPGVMDNLANDAIEAHWAEWQRVADVTGRQHFRDLCETLVGGLPSDGEFLVAVVRGAAAGNRYGFGLQLIDVDRIDTTYNGRHGSNAVIMGVEVNEVRRPVALHLFVAHPQDHGMGRTRVRLPMADVIHAFKVERGEQLRGIPWMAPGMLSLHHLGNFKLSALLAAEHGANHYGFFTTPDGQSPVGGVGADGEAVTVSQPGMYDTLPAGVSFQAYDSKYPEANFGPFVKTTLQRIASGWGVAYHSLANDLEGVSFSSIRSGTLEERDRWMGDQEWFISTFLEPVFRAWLEWCLMAGHITMPNGSPLPAAKREKFLRHEWQARRWDWVDPKADTEANILKVKAGLMSPQDLAAAMGYDFEDTLKAIAQAKALAAQYGVPLPAYDALPGASAAVASAQPAAAPTEDAAAKAMATLVNGLQEQQARTLEAVRELREWGTPAAQPVQIALQTDAIDAAMGDAMGRMAELAAEHIKQVADAIPINLNVNVPEQPAPTVNVTVAAPDVSVEAVLPAPTVTVVDNHPSRAIQTVERDRNDEITRTITTFEK